MTPEHEDSNQAISIKVVADHPIDIDLDDSSSSQDQQSAEFHEKSQPIISITTNNTNKTQNIRDIKNSLDHDTPTESLTPTDHNTSSIKPLSSYINNFPLPTTTQELRYYYQHVSMPGHTDPNHAIPKGLRGPFEDTTTPAFSYPFDKLFQLKGLPPGSASTLIPKMNFEQYWTLVNFQVRTMQLETNQISDSNQSTLLAEVFLQRLGLAAKVIKGHSKAKIITDIKTYLDKEPLNQETIENLKNLMTFHDPLTLPSQYNIEKAISYLHGRYHLYKDIGIDIEPANDANDISKTIIKQGNTPLVTITYDPKLQASTHYKVEIASGLTQKASEKAMFLIIDQTIKSKELTNTAGISVYGFEDNPKAALKLFMLAMNSGLSNIDIEKETKAAWKAKSTSIPDDQENPYKQALDMINSLETLSCRCNEQKRANDGKLKADMDTYWEKIHKMKVPPKSASQNPPPNSNPALTPVLPTPPPTNPIRP